MVTRSADPARSLASPDEAAPDGTASPAGGSEAAFLAWVVAAVAPAVVGRESEAPLRAVLERLVVSVTGSRRPLTDEAARAIAVPPGTTVGEAAALLRWTVEDGAGPRCRSYRAAIYFLRDRVEGAVPRPMLPR